MFLYNAMGDLRGTKFIIEKHHHRAQLCHPTLHNERYDVRTIKLKGAQFDQVGNFTQNTWDCSTATTNLFQDATFRRHLTAIHKDEAIALLEGWGVKYILLDEMRKPSVQDSIYVRHHLFAHKFYYLPFPVTNAYYRDADWKWKGGEEINYENYGAKTNDVRNSFKSLWSAAVKAANSIPLASVTKKEGVSSKTAAAAAAANLETPKKK